MGGFEDSSVTTKPCWTAAQAAELALDRYGLSGDDLVAVPRPLVSRFPTAFIARISGSA